MSGEATSGDTWIRELERRGRGGRSLEDVVRLGLARLRSGQLDEAGARLVERLGRGEIERAQLELQAYLGEPTALELLDHEAVAYAAFVGEEAAVHVVLRDAVTYADLAAWAPGLIAWGAPRVVAAFGAVGEVALDELERSNQTPIVNDPHGEWAYDRDRSNERLQAFREALGQLRRWVACPCAEHAAAVVTPEAGLDSTPWFYPSERALGSVRDHAASLTEWQLRAGEVFRDAERLGLPPEGVRAAIVARLLET